MRNLYHYVESDDTWILDTNNDGSEEIVQPSYVEDGQVISIDHYDAKPGFTDGILQPVEPGFSATDVVLADVDNDGQPEVVCVALAACHTLTLFYKNVGGYKYELLERDPDTAAVEGSDSPWFFNVTVVDGDGQMEVVSEPKITGYLPPRLATFGDGAKKTDSLRS